MADGPRAALIREAGAGEAGGRAPTVEWCGLCFSVGDKTILKDVSGGLEQGRLAAILGPSGAGKSTLLNVLAGRQRTEGEGYSLSGAIQVGGQVVTPRELKRRVAFVMQDDALLATQTVEESLRFSSALKRPGLTPQQRSAEVDELLDGLGLKECRSTAIGSALVKGVSGGERKRTSVGVELITNPSMVLLDEPTSGLDSFAAAELVKLLKALARRGRIVCCTIHQPSSEVFELFEEVTCLRAGEVLYQGPGGDQLQECLAAAQMPCPGGYNAADWLLMVAQTRSDGECAALEAACSDRLLDRDGALAGLKGRVISGEVDTGSLGHEVGQQPREVPRVGFWRQVALVTRRDLLNVLRDKRSFGARMGTTLGQAILYAMLFTGIAKNDQDPTMNSNIFGALVSMNIAGLFGAAQPTLLNFPLERPVFLREHSSQMYSIWSYFLSKTLVEMLVSSVQVTILVTISYLAMGFQRGLQGYLLFLVYVWLQANAAASMAIWLGCCTSSPASAIQLAPAIFVPQVLFSGLFLQIKQVPSYLRWVQYVCTLKYGIDLVCIVEFGGDDRVGGEELLDIQNINKDMKWAYTLLLVGLFLAYRLMALVVLNRKARYVF